MNVILIGSCDKHDFVLTSAALVRTYTNRSVEILTDYEEHYRFFEGEAHGVRISNVENSQGSDIQIYDLRYGMSSKIQDPHVYLMTNYERQAVETAETVLRQLKGIEPEGLIIEETDCQINQKYIQSVLPLEIPTFSYLDDPGRKIDMVYRGRIDTKPESSFRDAINEFVAGCFKIPSKDIKKVWNYVKRKG